MRGVIIRTISLAVVMLFLFSIIPGMTFIGVEADNDEELSVLTTIYVNGFDNYDHYWSCWDEDSDSGYDCWDHSSYKPRWGAGSLDCSSTGDSPPGDYDDNMDAYAYETIDTSAAPFQVEVSWWQWISTEGYGYDNFYATIWADGEEEVHFGQSGDFPYWAQKSFTIEGGTNTIEIEFRFCSDYSVHWREGAFIDSLYVKGYTVRPELGIEWVETYDENEISNLPGAKEAARGFASELEDFGFDWEYDYGNDYAWEQDYKYNGHPEGGEDDAYADNVDICWFSGHGDPYFFYFNDPDHDDRKLMNTDAEWGDQDLEWICLHACDLLKNDGSTKAVDRWGGAFAGLHQILGFAGPGWCGGKWDPFGSYFAERCCEGDTIWTAWNQASYYHQPGGTEVAMLYTYNAFNDHIWGAGSVANDIDNPALSDIYYTSVVYY